MASQGGRRGRCMICGGVAVALLPRKPMCLDDRACLRRWKAALRKGDQP